MLVNCVAYEKGVAYMTSNCLKFANGSKTHRFVWVALAIRMTWSRLPLRKPSVLRAFRRSAPVSQRPSCEYDDDILFAVLSW